MSQIKATDLRAGSSFLYEGKPFKVLKYTLIKMGRGGATVRVRCINLENASNVEHAFSSNLSFEKIELFKKNLQYLYKDATTAFFMDTSTYEQVGVSLRVLGNDILYLKEGDLVSVMFWDERPMSVELPPNLIFKVVEADPGIKGNSASNFLKSAKLENGLLVKVPLFINVGEEIRIDTRTGEYIERAK